MSEAVPLSVTLDLNKWVNALKSVTFMLTPTEYLVINYTSLIMLVN